jgi:hypothetical protein
MAPPGYAVTLPERDRPMIRLDAATVLLQWSVGGMLFCWFTTRRRVVGLGYGWLLRGVYLVMAGAAFAVGVSFGVVPIREAASIGVVLTILLALTVSVVRKSAGVSGQRADFDQRSERVAAMTGIERAVEDPGVEEPGVEEPGVENPAVDDGPSPEADTSPGPGAEFPPVLDLVPVIVGTVGLLAAAVDAGGNTSVAIIRTLVGAAFLGAITDAMLLGHWYLVQPGLPRRLLNEIVTAVGWIWPFEVLAMLLPTGMIAVFTGEIDDGWGGMLGWMWAACAITTIVLVVVTKAALKERYYSAVMAATGLLYLAILTGFGTDIVARAVLAGST